MNANPNMMQGSRGRGGSMNTHMGHGMNTNANISHINPSQHVRIIYLMLLFFKYISYLTCMYIIDLFLYKK